MLPMTVHELIAALPEPEEPAARCRLYAIVFEAAGVFLYGSGPDSLAHWTREPAFLFQDFFDATVCAWREAHDTTRHHTAWRCGPVEFDQRGVDPDGAEHLLGTLVAGTAAAYAEYARDYFELDIDTDAAAAVFDGRPLTAAIVGALNPDAVFADVARIAVAAGYPVEGALEHLD